MSRESSTENSRSDPLLQLEPAAVDVWVVPIDGPDDAAMADRELAVLSADERVRHDRRRQPSARREFRKAHALVRCALSRYAAIRPEAWRFEVGPHGRPEVASDPPGRSLSFNLSHTRGMVVCAVTSGARIGVDVECADRVRSVSRLADRVLSEHEREDLRGYTANEQQGRFLDYWTLKEAFLKAVGRGITIPLRSVEFGIDADGRIHFTPIDAAMAAAGADRWHFQLAPPSIAHRMAIAISGAIPPRITLRAGCP